MREEVHVVKAAISTGFADDCSGFCAGKAVGARRVMYCTGVGLFRKAPFIHFNRFNLDQG